MIKVQDCLDFASWPLRALRTWACSWCSCALSGLGLSSACRMGLKPPKPETQAAPIGSSCLGDSIHLGVVPADALDSRVGQDAPKKQTSTARHPKP